MLYYNRLSLDKLHILLLVCIILSVYFNASLYFSFKHLKKSVDSISLFYGTYDGESSGEKGEAEVIETPSKHLTVFKVKSGDTLH